MPSGHSRRTTESAVEAGTTNDVKGGLLKTEDQPKSATLMPYFVNLGEIWENLWTNDMLFLI
jgi:hypothetical protein